MSPLNMSPLASLQPSPITWYGSWKSKFLLKKSNTRLACLYLFIFIFCLLLVLALHAFHVGCYSIKSAPWCKQFSKNGSWQITAERPELESELCAGSISFKSWDSSYFHGTARHTVFETLAHPPTAPPLYYGAEDWRRQEGGWSEVCPEGMATFFGSRALQHEGGGS